MINLGIYFETLSSLCTYLDGKPLINVPNTEAVFLNCFTYKLQQESLIRSWRSPLNLTRGKTTLF